MDGHPEDGPTHAHEYGHEYQHAYIHHMQASRDYDGFMRQKGFRVTPQRQIILDTIMQSGGHIRLDDIYERVHAQAPAINRATLYRTLDFLCELRLVSVSEISGHRLYEIIDIKAHHHLICRTCGKEEQISSSELQFLFDEVKSRHGFTVDMDHIILLGQCAECSTLEKLEN